MFNRPVAAFALAALLSACNQQPAAPESTSEVAVEDIASDAASQMAAAPEAPAPQPLAGAFEAIPIFADAAAFNTYCQAGLDDVTARFHALEGQEGERTIATIMQPADEMWLLMANTWQVTGLMMQTSTDEAIRKAAEECDQKFVTLSTDISLSRPLYDRFAAVSVEGTDEATQFSHFKALRDFKRAGVDKDEATRAKIRTIIEEMNLLSQNFSRVIRDDVRSIELTNADQLAGLPEDYIASHPPNEAGKIVITTDTPDYVPFMTYAQDDAARKELRIAHRSRGYPDNDANLKGLLEKRYELAQVLGYPNYAAYVTEDKMVGTPERAQAFIDEIAQIVKGPVEHDKAVLLERLRQLDPAAADVGSWQYVYLQELVRKEQYAIDSKELRPYFQFARVRQGIFDLTSDLFGIEIKDRNTPVWAPGVTAHEIWQGDKLVGRFYLDLHPREGKYKHAAHFPVALGIEGVQVPVSALVTNMPGGEDPNELMEFDDVVTFLHEFGHLLHHQFGGHGAWVNNSGVATEWDFVEAPSQLLEEWAYDYDTLKTFAINAQGQPIPEELVQKLNRARFFGRGIDTAIQTFYASLSMNYYNRDPKTFELLPMMREIEGKYSPFAYLPGTYFYDSFGHLDGYSAIYYTYQWSLAIATDLFSRFKAEGMRNTDLSVAYREDVLDPGGSEPADALIRSFLGRDWTTAAYRDWLNRTE